MNGAYAGLGAAVTIAGVFVVISGMSAKDRPTRIPGLHRLSWNRIPRQTRLRFLLGCSAGLIVFILTGFLPTLILIPILLIVLPDLLRTQQSRDIAMMEALDRWVRLLAASVGTGKSVGQALQITSRQVPGILSAAVASLVQRIDEGWTLREALQQMADELDTGDADSVLAALVLVGERGGVGASSTLRALSENIQNRLHCAREVVAERAKPQFVVRQVTAITLAGIGLALVFSPEYFSPFGTALGQVLMLALGAGYLGSLFVLRRLALPARRERILVRPLSHEVTVDA